MIQQSHFLVFTQKKAKTLKDTCTPMFTAALFIIAKIWKQSKYPLIDRKDVRLDRKIMEYYSDILKNEILPAETM